MQRFLILILLLFITGAQLGCTNHEKLGSKKNPIKFYLVPAQDRQALLDNGALLQNYLEKELDESFTVELPTSFIAVIEAFGSKRADVALINTFGYIIAREKYQVDARLRVTDQGRDQYHGQIIARADSKISTISDLNGKKFAYVDPASASGYLLPSGLFKAEKITLKEHVFAGRHDSVVMAVYNKQVDAGATFNGPTDADGTPQDARKLIKTQHPDVFSKIKIIKLTGPIPNDPIIFRKDLPEELKVKIATALKKYIATPAGARVLHNMFHFTGFKDVRDQDYDEVRSYLKSLGQSAEDFAK
ncbi:MAG: phosphate/phosphite/phosphonate ABC transporter substrate-binding protein [Bdellovibrionaceae bacterium]|nr:phosphate/phosphite/phosphonate ABC transporter substrate-binding protein [Bdellovibrio sp.]